MLSNILMGFSTAFNPMNLLLLMGGTVLGILFGALPGVSSTMGVAVLIPHAGRYLLWFNIWRQYFCMSA